MILFLFSRDWQDQHEYLELRRYMESQHDPSEYFFAPIEDVNVLVTPTRTALLLLDKELPMEQIYASYVLGLGHVTPDTLAYRIAVLRLLERFGVAVINSPESILNCRNKLCTTLLLQARGLPIIRTLAVSNGGIEVLRDIDEGREPLIKPLSGSGGYGVVRLPESDRDLAAHLVSWRSVYGIPLAQPFLSKKDDSDIRLFVIGTEVVASMRRQGPAGSVTTNIRQGGTAITFSPSERLTLLAVHSVAAVGACVATVDILQDENDELYVLEVNGMARWRGLQRVTDAPICQLIAKYLVATPSGKQSLS